MPPKHIAAVSNNRFVYNRPLAVRVIVKATQNNQEPSVTIGNSLTYIAVKVFVEWYM